MHSIWDDDGVNETVDTVSVSVMGRRGTNVIVRVSVLSISGSKESEDDELTYFITSHKC